MLHTPVILLLSSFHSRQIEDVRGHNSSVLNVMSFVDQLESLAVSNGVFYLDIFDYRLIVTMQWVEGTPDVSLLENYVKIVIPMS